MKHFGTQPWVLPFQGTDSQCDKQKPSRIPTGVWEVGAEEGSFCLSWPDCTLRWGSHLCSPGQGATDRHSSGAVYGVISGCECAFSPAVFPLHLKCLQKENCVHFSLCESNAWCTGTLTVCWVNDSFWKRFLKVITKKFFWKQLRVRWIC